MSLAFLSSLQKKLCEILRSDQNINNIVKTIYFGTVQDIKDNLIIIKILQMQDLSIQRCQMCRVKFDILCYAQDVRLLYQLLDLIIQAVDDSDPNFDPYYFASIKASNVTFDKARDLVTNRLVINYATLIKRAGYELS